MSLEEIILCMIPLIYPMIISTENRGLLPVTLFVRRVLARETGQLKPKQINMAASAILIMADFKKDVQKSRIAILPPISLSSFH
jgi:hypothetical protein